MTDTTTDGPAQLKKEDSWVRGNRLQLERAIYEARTADSTHLWSTLYLGDAAIKLMKGVATAEEVGKLMANIIAKCEMDVQAGARQLLEMGDLTTPEAQLVHFNTRVSAGIINRLNQMVHDGQQAASEIESHNEGE